jgi:hypothetical protein
VSTTSAPDANLFERRWSTLGYEQSPPCAVDALRETLRAEPVPPLAATVMSEVDPSGRPAHDAVLPEISLGESSASRSVELRVLRRLGEGGMGTVDLAEQRSLAREVAVKRLRDEVADGAHVAALLHEGRVMGRLEHPAIVPVHALGVDSARRPVLVMKRVDGVSWAALIDDPAHRHWAGRASDDEARVAVHLDVLSRVCDALRFAHDRGVIHRDVKPENVMLGEFGEVYLLDWGVALDRHALTDADLAERQVVGTPCFMAPELFDQPVRAHDERTDVYLHGATLHAVMLSSFLSEPVAYGEGVSDELARLCNEATARDPAGRPQTVEQFQRRIAEHQRHRGSLSLARAARASLDPVLALTAQERGATRARTQLAEAHFGFVQALRQWPDNAAARDGLQRALCAAIERELAARNVDATRGLLSELPEPVPSLEAACDALARSLEEQSAQADAHRRRAAEMDSSVSAGARVALALIGLAFTAGSLAFYFAFERGPGRAPPEMLAVVQSDLALLAVFSTAVWVIRRRLLANTISKQLTLTLGAVIAGGLCSDIQGYLAHTSVGAATVQRFNLGAFVLAVAGVGIERALFVPAAISLAASFAMALWPASIELVGSVASLLVVLAFVWSARRSKARG